MSVYGVVTHKGFSQKSLTITQLIQGNFKKHVKNRRTKLVKSQKVDHNIRRTTQIYDAYVKTVKYSHK